MLFRNVFSIFKLEVKNCGPQSTVLNTIKIHVYSCFSASLKNHVRVMLLHGDNFQPSRDWPSSWRMHPSSGAPYSPRFLILTRIAFTSCLHPHLAPPPPHPGFQVCNLKFKHLEQNSLCQHRKAFVLHSKFTQKITKFLTVCHLHHFLFLLPTFRYLTAKLFNSPMS